MNTPIPVHAAFNDIAFALDKHRRKLDSLTGMLTYLQDLTDDADDHLPMAFAMLAAFATDMHDQVADLGDAVKSLKARIPEGAS